MGRRNTCQNNQHNISLSLTQFAYANKHYPGYANMAGTRTSSFLVQPFMYPNEYIYQIWIQPDGTDAPKQAAVYVPRFVCPSNEPSSQRGTPNAYVINAGQADAAKDASADTIRANGIATDQTVADPVTVDQDYIVNHDGTAFTLLLSENIQAQVGALTQVDPLYTGTTFLWWNSPPAGTKDYRINVGRTPAKPAPRLVDCRPSSNHPGGVVVSFCDGHVRFIAEDIEYEVYKQLMTPNGAESGDTVNRELKDNDF